MRAAAAFGGYVAASLLWFGIPILDNPDGSVVGTAGIEQSFHIWSLEWWVHAVGDGINPFHSDVIYAPDGFNLAWAAAIPGASALAAPITVPFGPTVAFNAWAILAPALAGWGTFLLCDRITGRFWPSFAGGYAFGFSSYMVAAATAHLNLMLAAIAVPLAVYLFIRALEGSLTAVRFVLLMAAVLAFEFLAFTESFATLTGFAVVAVAAAGLIFPAQRPGLKRTLVLTAVAYAVAAVFLAPYLYYALSDPSELAHVSKPEDFSTDPLNLVVPTEVTALGGDPLSSLSRDFGGNAAEQFAYLGLPLLAMLGWFALDTRHRRVAALTLGVAGAAIIASLGPELHIAGADTGVPMPWWPLARTPLLEYALPARVMVYAWLPVAVALAIWLSSARGSFYRWGLVVLAGVSLAPNLGGSFPGSTAPLWHADLFTPRFFEERTYERFLDPGETMFVFPPGPAGLSMLWQAEADMGFEMAGGYASAGTPPDYRCWPIDLYLQFGIPQPNASKDLLAFLHAKRAAIAVAPEKDQLPPALRVPDALPGLLDVGPIAHTGGVRVYRVPGAELASRRAQPACPERSSD